MIFFLFGLLLTSSFFVYTVVSKIRASRANSASRKKADDAPENPSSKEPCVRLRSKLEQSRVRSVFFRTPRDFIPKGTVDALITEEWIQKCLVPGPFQGKSLVEFIKSEAKTLFAITVCCESSSKRVTEIMEALRLQNRRDLDLPFSEDQLESYLKSGRKFTLKQWIGKQWVSEQWTAKQWTTKQWMFLAPVLSSANHYRVFQMEETLPFIEKFSGPQKSSNRGACGYRIHKDHVESASSDDNLFSVKEAKFTGYPGETAGQWRQEIEYLCKINDLNQKNIARFITAFSRNHNRDGTEKEYYLISEFPTLGTMRDMLEFYPPPGISVHSIKMILEQLLGIATALDAVHIRDEISNNSGHGDLRPENVLVFPGDDPSTTTFKIGGWSQAQKYQGAAGGLSNITGKSANRQYEAPEIEIGKKAGRHAERYSPLNDMWALGCITLELVTWLLHGWDELRIRKNTLAGKPFFQMGKPQDGPNKNEEAYIRGDVLNWIKDIQRDPRCIRHVPRGTFPGLKCQCQHPKCTVDNRLTAIGSLLKLVKNSLLVVDLPQKHENCLSGTTGVPQYTSIDFQFSTNRTPTRYCDSGPSEETEPETPTRFFAADFCRILECIIRQHGTEILPRKTMRGESYQSTVRRGSQQESSSRLNVNDSPKSSRSTFYSAYELCNRRDSMEVTRNSLSTVAEYDSGLSVNGSPTSPRGSSRSTFNSIEKFNPRISIGVPSESSRHTLAPPEETDTELSFKDVPGPWKPSLELQQPTSEPSEENGLRLSFENTLGPSQVAFEPSQAIFETSQTAVHAHKDTDPEATIGDCSESSQTIIEPSEAPVHAHEVVGPRISIGGSSDSSRTILEPTQAVVHLPQETIPRVSFRAPLSSSQSKSEFSPARRHPDAEDSPTLSTENFSVTQLSRTTFESSPQTQANSLEESPASSRTTFVSTERFNLSKSLEGVPESSQLTPQSFYLANKDQTASKMTVATAFLDWRDEVGWEYQDDNKYASSLFAALKDSSIVSTEPYKIATHLCSRCIEFRDRIQSLDDFVTRKVINLRRGSNDSNCELCTLFSGPDLPSSLEFDKSDPFLRLENNGRPVFTITHNWQQDHGPTFNSQIGFVKLPPAGSTTHLSLLKYWLDDCDKSHPCHPKARSSKPQTVRLPTRLIDVGEEGDSRVHLWETKSGDTAEWIALSHRWGSRNFSTTRENLQEHLEGWELSDLPATFKDAVTVTRALGHRHLWIDSLCIIQGAKGDFAAEAKRMEQVYSGAYCVIAASCATDHLSGFLSERKERNYVGLCREGEPQKPLYICRNVDNFRGHVLNGSLNKRGWVLQEHVLARRTLFFTEHQTYFECGDGIRCETSTKLNNPFARVLGDPYFPEILSEQNNGDIILHFQELYSRYSRLELKRPSDRPAAIEGLQKRLIRTIRVKGGFGVFYQKKSANLLGRSLLWHRSKEALKRIQFPTEHNRIPSWSWMAYTGGIDYLEPGFGEYHWEDLQSPWSASKTNTENPVLRATAWEYKRASAKNAQSILDDPWARPQLVTLCVVLGKARKSASSKTQQHFVLLVSATGGTSENGEPLYERAGVGCFPANCIKFTETGRDVVIQ